MRKIYAIVTGDLVNSRNHNAKVWLPVLENSLKEYSTNFDIFRGDSFQAEVELEKSFEILFYIKAKIKSISQLDVRFGLGYGSIENLDKHIKNSTGEAFINSGEAFDELKKELINMQSPWREWDIPVNLMLQLSTELANKWTENMAESVAATFENPLANQQQLANILHRKYQSQVSTELNKASFMKIKKVIEYCTHELLKQC